MPQSCSARLVRGALLVVLSASVFVAVLVPVLARAQAGSTLTPDRLTYVVNKDVGAERWTINLNLASLDPQRAINVTGNVYRSGQSPSFVWCQERADSTGTLADPGSTFRLRCSGASACGATATGCARSEWSTIADLVAIPASFFLPPGGNGLARARSSTAGSAVVAAPSVPAVQTKLALGQALLPSATAAPAGGVSDRGANLPPDGANFLVNKELGGLRWSISLNQIPAQRGNDAVSTCDDALECIVSNRFLNVTGNVYPQGGGPPQFVWCQERQDSTGDLANPQSEFRFGCVGAGACEKSANECADQDWQTIPGGADVRLQASFFLPPGGLPATPQSDPEIVVIGRTSDPPSMIVPLGQGAAAVDVATVLGGCGEGGTCTLSAGSCGSVQGRIVLDATVGCACLVSEVPPECIACGGGASGVCGGNCQYQIGDQIGDQIGGATARGQCLPFSSTSTQCSCYAANQSDQVAISICGGSLGSECPSGKCCADDIRDGCDPAAGDVDCGGICVDSNGCDPTVSQCGSCLDQRDPATLFCGTRAAPVGASCCADCPDGTQNCYCEPGRSCNLEADGGRCCPTSRPDFCNGTICIPSGADCCADCPDGGNDCYCAAGSLCVLEAEGGGCCPVDAPIRIPGAGCCPIDRPIGCGDLCLAEGLECCPDGTSFCEAGFLCTADSLCVPAGDDDCGDGLSCEAGFQCVDESPGCCRTDLTCDESCLTAGEDCCGDGFFCDTGAVCVGEGAGATCCAADQPVGCGGFCLDPGSVCCGADGSFCDPGFTCDGPDSCVPVDSRAGTEVRLQRDGTEASTAERASARTGDGPLRSLLADPRSAAPGTRSRIVRPRPSAPARPGSSSVSGAVPQR